MSRDEKDKKKKKRQSILEAEIMAIINKSMKACIDEALKDLFKGFK